METLCPWSSEVHIREAQCYENRNKTGNIEDLIMMTIMTMILMMMPGGRDEGNGTVEP